MPTASGRLRMRFTIEEELLEMRTILAYEAGVRGGSTAQTFCELVLGAADVRRYPVEVRERLREIDCEARRHAAEKALAEGHEE